MTEAFQRTDITLANWRLSPFSRYSFQHVAEFVPTADVSAPGEREAPSQGPAALAEMMLEDTDGSLR